VIIFKKLAHGFYFVVPTTTQPKTGSWFVQFKQKDRTMYASLHQARAIDYRRLYSKLGSLDETDQSSVRWRGRGKSPNVSTVYTYACEAQMRVEMLHTPVVFRH
jgi:hypothetical protein